MTTNEYWVEGEVGRGEEGRLGFGWWSERYRGHMTRRGRRIDVGREAGKSSSHFPFLLHSFYRLMWRGFGVGIRTGVLWLEENVESC